MLAFGAGEVQVDQNQLTMSLAAVALQEAPAFMESLRLLHVWLENSIQTKVGQSQQPTVLTATLATIAALLAPLPPTLHALQDISVQLVPPLQLPQLLLATMLQKAPPRRTLALREPINPPLARVLATHAPTATSAMLLDSLRKHE
jgi:hypothetical protein